MTAMTESNRFPPAGYHVQFPFVLAGQVLEFANMVHNQIVRRPAYLALFGFQPVYKACRTRVRHVVR